MLITLTGFSGIAPKIPSRLLASNMAQTANNVRLWTGALDAMPSSLTIVALSIAPKSIYRFGNSSIESQYWFQWPTDVCVVGSLIADDTTSRTHWTGDGIPKTTNDTLARTGGAPYPRGAYMLGVPAPINPPTLTSSAQGLVISSLTLSGLVVTATTAVPIAVAQGDTFTATIVDATDVAYNGTYKATATGINTFTYVLTGTPVAYAGTAHYSLTGGLTETRAYVYTFVSSLGEESGPSPATVFDVPAGHAVSLTMDAMPSGNFVISTRRIYRTSVGTAGTNYYFVAQIAGGTTTYTDTKLGTELNEVLPSLGWAVPPADMHGLCAVPNGFLAGFTGKTVCFCVPYHPHAWPVAYQQTTDYTIVGLAILGQSLIVLTDGMPYMVTGSHPSAMSMSQIDFEQACLSRRSISKFGNGIVYASPDGLAYIGSDGTRILTEAHFSRKEWQALKPASIHGYLHDSRYYGFYDTGTVRGGFIFDPSMTSGSPFTTFDTYATAGFNDLKNDALYLAVGTHIVRLDGGVGSLTYTWKSPSFTMPWTESFTCAKVVAASYLDLTASFYLDGSLIYSVSVPSPEAFRIPAQRASTMEIELTGTDTVVAAYAASTFAELERV